jgi:hypothetical protein
MATTPINDNTPKAQYIALDVGGGVGQTQFPYLFWVGKPEHLDVYRNSTLLTLNLDYTITGIELDAGGTVTLSATLPGDVITLVRDTIRQRSQGYTDPAGITARALNFELALYLCMIQELSLTLRQTLRYGPTASPSLSLVLPNPIANYFLGWNADGTALENKSGSGGGGGGSLPGFGGHERKLVRVNAAGSNVEYIADQPVKTQLFSPVRCLISTVDVSGDSVTTNVAHGLATGALVRLRAVDGGVYPVPLTGGGYYNVRNLGTNGLAFFPTALDASNNTNRINLTTTGLGRIEVIADPASLDNGDIWISDGVYARLNSLTVQLADALNGMTLPTRYQATAKPVYVNANTFTVASISCRDGADSKNLIKTTSTTVNTTVTGFNGILGGGLAANTWYNLYAISDGKTTGLALSTRNVAGGESLINLPDGYTYFRQLPFALKTDASANILPFLVSDKTIFYRDFDPTVGPYNMLTNGAATSFAGSGVNVGGAVPDIARVFKLWCQFDSSDGSKGYLRVGNTSSAGVAIGASSNIVAGAGSVIATSIIDWQLAGTNKTVEYRTSNAATGFMSLAVQGFTVTEVA